MRVKHVNERIWIPMIFVNKGFLDFIMVKAQSGSFFVLHTSYIEGVCTLYELK